MTTSTSPPWGDVVNARVYIIWKVSPTTRESLLVAATALLDDGGPETVTLREVGRRAGVSHNAPYKHFDDKQALLAAVAARELSEYAALLSAEGDLATAMRGYVRRALLFPARFRLVYGPWTADSAVLEQNAKEAWGALLLSVVAAQESGTLPAGSPTRLANLVRSVTHGAIALALEGHLAKGDEPTTPEQLIDGFIALLHTR